MTDSIGLRVDIDFEIGLTKGVPYLLDIFRFHDIRASFFVAMGPDRFMRNMKRVKDWGYIRRIIAFNPVHILRKFGYQYLFKRFIGSSRSIGADHADILIDILKAGHELGVHGYDHFWWAENIWSTDIDSIRKEIRKGMESFRTITGIDPTAWASPNWRCSTDTMLILEEMRLQYGSDCRGKSPFYPMIHEAKGNILQLPVTLPCLHEAKQFLNTDKHFDVCRYVTSKLQDQYNVLCIHGYYEGLLQRRIFQRLITELKQLDLKCVPLAVLNEKWKSANPDTCGLIKKQLPGGRGFVSYQGAPV